MTAASWHRAAFWLARPGWPGWAGAALLAAALTLAACELPRQQARLAQLRAAPASAVLRPLAPPPSPLAGLLTERDEVRVLGDLFRAADQAGLQLDRGAYRVTRAQHGRIAVLAITLPLTGIDAAVRGFLAAIVSATPGLAIESLVLRRPDIATTDLTADVHLALFLKVNG